MKVYVVVASDDDSRESIEALFTKKRDAEAYMSLLDDVSGNSETYDIREHQLDAPQTLPGVIGFRVCVRDGDTPHTTGPVVLGRLDGEEQSGRYDGGAMKGVRYAWGEGPTYADAAAAAVKARDAVGKLASKRKAKGK